MMPIHPETGETPFQYNLRTDPLVGFGLAAMGSIFLMALAMGITWLITGGFK